MSEPETPKTPEEPVASGKERRKQNTLLIAVAAAIVIILAGAGSYFLLSGQGVPGQVAGMNDSVAVYYTEYFENGTVIDSNVNATTPLVFTIGNSSVISGFQKAVIGMSVDQVKTVNLSYLQAYGAYDPGLVQTINRTGPIANTTFVPGETYNVYYRPTNSYSKVKILNVTDKTITWDANNPLVGYNLTFTIKLAGIKKA